MNLRISIMLASFSMALGACSNPGPTIRSSQAIFLVNSAEIGGIDITQNRPLVDRFATAGPYTHVVITAPSAVDAEVVAVWLRADGVGQIVFKSGGQPDKILLDGYLPQAKSILPR